MQGKQIRMVYRIELRQQFIRQWFVFSMRIATEVLLSNHLDARCSQQQKDTGKGAKYNRVGNKENRQQDLKSILRVSFSYGLLSGLTTWKGTHAQSQLLRETNATLTQDTRIACLLIKLETLFCPSNEEQKFSISGRFISLNRDCCHIGDATGSLPQMTYFLLLHTRQLRP